MTSCTNAWVQNDTGQLLGTSLANIPSYRLQPQNQQSAVALRNDSGHHQPREPSEKEYCDEDSMSINSDKNHDSLDGESLDTYDRMDLVARGAFPYRELGEACYPLTIEFEGGYPCISDDMRSDSCSDESTSWSNDDTSKTTEMFYSSDDEISVSTTRTSGSNHDCQ